MLRLRFVPSITVLLSLPTLLFFFTNCSPMKGDSSGAGSASKVSGNGGSYDGKLEFVALRTTGVCADGSANETQIEVTPSGPALVTRENCRAVVPAKAIPAGPLQIMAHNPSNAIHGPQVLDKVVPGFLPTDLMCRGNETQTFKEGDFSIIADTVIRRPASGTRAQLKIGVYDKDGVAKNSPYSVADFPMNFYVSENLKYDVFVTIAKHNDKRYRIKVFVNRTTRDGFLEFALMDTYDPDPPAGELRSVGDPPQNRIAISCFSREK